MSCYRGVGSNFLLEGGGWGGEEDRRNQIAPTSTNPKTGHLLRNRHLLGILVHPFCVIHNYCIHRIVSGGYYGFDFVTPPSPQCVERFHRYRSNEKIL